MDIGAQSICVKVTRLAMIAAVSAYAGAGVVLRSENLRGSVAAVLFLAIAGGILARIQSRDSPRTAVPRLSIAFVLAGLLLLPASAAILLGLLVAVSAHDDVPAGVRPGGFAGFAGFSVALVLTALAMAHSPYAAVPGTPGALAILALGFVLLHGLTSSVGAAASRKPFARSTRPARRDLRRWGVEAFGIPIAWILAASIDRGAWLEAATATVVTIGVAMVLSGGSLTNENFRRARGDLESRVAELATLHAIGREIVTAVQPQRVFEIIERECSKILDVEDCMIAFAERPGGELRAAFRRTRGCGNGRTDGRLRRGLVSSVAEAKTARCVGDSRGDAATEDDRLQNPEARSGIVAPMIAKGRVIGVISIESSQPEAYDDHQLAVMMTIAQQAAVAIENGRHYQLATTDALTEFFSRDHFFERLEEEHRRVRRYGGRFAVMMLDLDGFKEINDRCGHLAGDEYLRRIAKTVRSKLRDADLPCRYGGDEFCVLLPETSLNGARAIAERIRVAVSRRSVGLDGRRMRTTVSIGVAAFPEHDAGKLNGLLRNADDALYRAKREGRDRVVPFAA